MSIKSTAAKLLAKRDVKRINIWANNPIEAQAKTFAFLSSNLYKTAYGSDLGISNTNNLADWHAAVPLVDYEQLRSYVERVKNGEHNVLYPGLPQYLCTTSGTTSGAKYIPMTEHGIKAQILAARNSLLCYLNETKKTSFINKKVIFLQGSPLLGETNGIKTGRLSGIVAHYTPSYLRKNIMPSWENNCIEDWEEKVKEITKETIKEDMAVIGGIPPWVQMYFEKLRKESDEKIISKIFPNFRLFVYGGVNYEPYRNTFNELIGKKITFMENYNASEGFFAIQDDPSQEGMLLLLDSGIYYEFIPMSDFYGTESDTIPLEKVDIGKEYAIVVFGGT